MSKSRLEMPFLVVIRTRNTSFILISYRNMNKNNYFKILTEASASVCLLLAAALFVLVMLYGGIKTSGLFLALASRFFRPGLFYYAHFSMAGNPKAILVDSCGKANAFENNTG